MDPEVATRVAHDPTGTLGYFLLAWAALQVLIELAKGYFASRRERLDSPLKAERRALTEMQAKQLTEIQTFQKEISRNLAIVSEKNAEIAHTVRQIEIESRESAVVRAALTDAIRRLEMSASEAANDHAVQNSRLQAVDDLIRSRRLALVEPRHREDQ